MLVSSGNVLMTEGPGRCSRSWVVSEAISLLAEIPAQEEVHIMPPPHMQIIMAQKELRKMRFRA